MLQITKDNDELIVHEMPVAQWLNSIVVGLMFGGLFFLGFSLLTKIFVAALSVGTIVFVAAFLIYLWDNPSTTVKINKQNKLVSIRKASLVGYKFNIYNFDEIADEIYVDEFGFMPKNHQILLPVRNGEKIELSTQIRMNEREYFDVADLMNSYIFDSKKPISAKTKALNKAFD